MCAGESNCANLQLHDAVQGDFNCAVPALAKSH
jgi:hypothetical protein